MSGEAPARLRRVLREVERKPSGLRPSGPEGDRKTPAIQDRSGARYSVLPIVRSSVPVRDRRNQYRLASNEIGDIIRKDRTVYSPISSRTLPPKIGVSKDAFDNVRNFSPKAQSQALFLGRIVQRCFPQLVASLREKLVVYRFSLLSSSAKTPWPETATVRPASYLPILSRISKSHAASTSAGISGSTLARMRCASVKRWSLGRSKASEAMCSSDFIAQDYCPLVMVASRTGSCSN